MHAAYDKKSSKMQLYVQTVQDTFKKEVKVVQYLNKYYALYIAYDGFYSAFNGKFAYISLLFGRGAFIDFSADIQLNMYVRGKDNLLLTKVVEDDSKFQLQYVDHSEDEGIVTEYLDGEYLIDGVYQYGYGLWTRFFQAIPSRVVQFPEML